LKNREPSNPVSFEFEKESRYPLPLVPAISNPSKEPSVIRAGI
jgi:hypothetical protein